MKINKDIATLSLAVMMLTLSACSGLTRSDEPAMKTWWLEPYDVLTRGDATAPPELLSLSVTVVPGLDTDRILTLSDNAELNHYGAARWPEHLPEVVASLTGRSLRSSGRFEMVSAGTAGGQDHCDLHLEVREFFANLESSGQTGDVSLTIHGRYQCKSAEKALPLQLEATVKVHDERMSVIVAAFQQAMDGVLRDLLKSLP